jgi:hypothetical protein
MFDFLRDMDQHDAVDLSKHGLLIKLEICKLSLIPRLDWVMPAH